MTCQIQVCSATSSATQRLELQIKQRLAQRGRPGGPGGGSAGGSNNPSEVALSISRLVTQQTMKGSASAADAISAKDVESLTSVPDEMTWETIKKAFVAQAEHLKSATSGEPI